MLHFIIASLTMLCISLQNQRMGAPLSQDSVYLVNSYEREQPVSRRVISLVEKTSHPPKLGPQKTVSIIAFRSALTLDVKIVWFGRQVAGWVQKRHKNAIFGFSWFQKFNFDYLLLKLLICSPTTENIFKFVWSCWLSHLSRFQWPKPIPPSFWPQVTNHDVKSIISKKWFFRSMLFYTTFSWCWKVEEKT